MIRFSKIFFYITVAVLLVWQLPWCYAFLTLKPVKTPFTMYSSVLGDWQYIYTTAGRQFVAFSLCAPAYGGRTFP